MKRIVVAVVIALGVVALGSAITSGLGDLDGISDPRPDPVPDSPLVEATEPPPDFGPPPSTVDLYTHWLRLLTIGDQDDVKWAKEQILRAGPDARKHVLERAKASLRSNSGFVQHVFDLLLEQPDEDALTLAEEALDHRDPHLAARAGALLAAIGGDKARATAKRLATIARDREGMVSRSALNALAHLGGEECLTELRNVLDELDPAHQGIGYLALARAGATSETGYLRERFDVSGEPAPENATPEQQRRHDVWHRLQIAEALVRLGDAHPNAWLAGVLEDTSGDRAFRDAALGVLAQARHPVALDTVRRELRGLATSERKELLLAQLRHFDLTPEVERLVSEHTGPQNREGLRVLAYELLVQGNAAGALDEVLGMLRHAGDGGPADRNVAALVLGRVRVPDAAEALDASARRLEAAGDRQAQLVVRALTLSGDATAAATVVKALVRDTSEYGSGGVSFGVMNVLSEARPEFIDAFAREVLAALDGTHGSPRKSGLQALLLAAGIYCGEPASKHLAAALRHEDIAIRQAGALGLGEVGGKGAKAALEQAWRRKQDVPTRAVIRTALEHLHFRAR